MKKFFVLLVAIALSTMLYAEKGSSNGQPFLTLQGQIDKLVGDADTVEKRLAGLKAATVKLELEVAVLEVDLGDLYTIVDEDAEATQDAIDALRKDIEYNLDLIVIMADEMMGIQDTLLLKQNIINGVCPDGQAVVSVNDEENDGVLICKSVSGSGSLQQTVITTLTVVAGHVRDTIEATCPVGTVLTGGGFRAGPEMNVLASSPQNNGWLVTGYNTVPSLQLSTLRAEAVCLKLQ